MARVVNLDAILRAINVGHNACVLLRPFIPPIELNNIADGNLIALSVRQERRALRRQEIFVHRCA
jgi:hypothetical protein